MSLNAVHSISQADQTPQPVPLSDIRDTVLDGQDEGYEPELCLNDEFNIFIRRFVHPSWTTDGQQRDYTDSQSESECMTNEMIRMWSECNQSKCNILDDPLVRIEIYGETYVLLRCLGTDETSAEILFISADEIDESVV